jgi:hypothetical protein
VFHRLLEIPGISDVRWYSLEVQIFKITRLQDYKITRLQDYKITRLQDYKITEISNTQSMCFIDYLRYQRLAV